MSTPVFTAVLVAAVLHAVWNAVVKGSVDKHAMMLAVSLGHIPIALLALAFAPPINTEALVWIIASVALHLGYQLFLIAAYRAGDLTLVYPIARGSAPVVVTAVSMGVLGLSFSRLELAGVTFIVLGMLALSLVRLESGVRNPNAAAMALCTGAFIAAYSLVDGIGARLASTALGYWSWAAIGNALVLGLWMAVRRPQTFAVIGANRRMVVSGLMGGTATFVAYGLVIWAFTLAPIALVTALRETSIIFALLIGVGVLKERLNLAKVAATLVTLVGAVLLRASKP